MSAKAKNIFALNGLKNTNGLDHRQIPVVNIFWTGGWDSTFRIVSLAGKEVIIRPYYIKENRKSEWHELNAMSVIRKELINRESTKCILNPVEILKVSDIPEDPEITDAYNYFRQKCHIGSQYEWLSRFAKKKKGVELGILKNGGICNLIKTHGKIKTVKSGTLGTKYLLDHSVSSREIITLFGNFHFPLIELNKAEMKKEAEVKGFIDIMNKTVFCHRPKDNKPCGECPPCNQAINDGMKYRFSDSALYRYRIKKLKEKVRLLLSRTGLVSVPNKSIPHNTFP